jgi:hypothetical protein
MPPRDIIYHGLGRAPETLSPAAFGWAYAAGIRGPGIPRSEGEESGNTAVRKRPELVAPFSRRPVGSSATGPGRSGPGAADGHDRLADETRGEE